MSVRPDRRPLGLAPSRSDADTCHVSTSCTSAAPARTHDMPNAHTHHTHRAPGRGLLSHSGSLVAALLLLLLLLLAAVDRALIALPAVGVVSLFALLLVALALFALLLLAVLAALLAVLAR